jgi:hypothetical protein
LVRVEAKGHQGSICHAAQVMSLAR